MFDRQPSDERNLRRVRAAPYHRRVTRLRPLDVLLAVLLLAVLLVWVLVPHALEGAVLFEFTGTHGVHVGDLVGAAVIARLGWWTLR